MRPDQSGLGSAFRRSINRERLANDSLHNQTASNALGTDADFGRGLTGLHPERLQVRAEPAFGDAGRLATVTAEVLRLTTFDLGITTNRLLTTD